MGQRFTVELMVRIHNSVMHFMIEGSEIGRIFGLPENGLTFIANHNRADFFEKNQVENIQNNEADSVGENRKDGGQNKK